MFLSSRNYKRIVPFLLVVIFVWQLIFSFHSHLPRQLLRENSDSSSLCNCCPIVETIFSANSIKTKIFELNEDNRQNCPICNLISTFACGQIKPITSLPFTAEYQFSPILAAIILPKSALISPASRSPPAV